MQKSYGLLAAGMLTHIASTAKLNAETESEKIDLSFLSNYNFIKPTREYKAPVRNVTRTFKAPEPKARK